MYLTINGIRYHVKKHLDDPKKQNILLLHGFMGSGKSFMPTLSYLEQFVNPVTIDLLGHGETQGAKSARRFEERRQIMDIKQIIDELFDEPPFLHGYSMGGRLALRYALIFSETVKGLILESTNYGLDDASSIRERNQTDENRALTIETDFASFVEEWKALPLFGNGMQDTENASLFSQVIQMQQDPKQMAFSLRGFGTGQMKSVKHKLSSLELPVLILAGQSDSKYTEIGRKMDHLFQQSSFNIIQNANHRVHHDQPAVFASVIKNYILESSKNPAK